MKCALTMLLLILVTHPTFAQNAPASAGHSTPIPANETFRQPSFRLSLPLPAGWHIASQEVSDFRKQKAMDLAQVDAAGHQQARERVRRLIVVQRHPSGTARGTNTSFSINSTFAGSALVGMTARQYQEAVVEQLMASGMKAEIRSMPTETKLGGRVFSKVETKITFKGFDVYQLQYDCFDGEYILNIQIAAPSVQELADTDRLIANIAFE